MLSDSQKSRPTDMIIFFLFSKSDVEQAYRKYNLLSGKCFALSAEVYQGLAELKVEVLDYQSYFSKNQNLVINRLSKQWASSWYRGDDKIFENLPLSLHNYFTKRLFQIAAIDNLFKKEKPSEVFLGKEGGGFEAISPIVKFLCKKQGIKLIDQSSRDFWFLRFLVQFLKMPKLVNFHFPKTNKKTILFVSHHYHIINCLGLLRHFQKSGQYESLITGRVSHAKKALDDHNLKFIDYNGGVSWESFFSYLSRKLQLFLELLTAAPIKKVFEYGSYDVSELVRPKLISLFLADGPNLAAHQLFGKTLLKAIRPVALLTVTNDSTIQTLIKVAKIENIPTLEIEHGFTIGEDGIYLKADKFGVWGKIPKAIYTQTGLNPKKMAITGWPAFEVYRNLPVKKLNSEKLTITFLAQDPEGMSLPFMTRTPIENLEIFFEAMSKFKNRARIVVRLHPRADERLPYVIAKKYHIDFELSANEKLEHLLLRSDIVVGQTTTATLDAIIMNKPVIYLPSMRWPAKFVEGTGAVYEAKDVGDIERFINLIIRKGISRQMLEAQQKFIENYCNFSKNSVDLISREIEEMINVQR